MRATEMNTQMSRLLGESGHVPNLSLDQRLAGLLKEGLTEEGGLVLLSAFARTDKSSPGRLLDETGLECFINHFHVNDYAPGPPSHQLQQAIAFARSLGELLERTRSHCVFRVIVSQSPDGTVVRFHKLRPGESFLGADLEKYKDEAIWTCLTSA